MVLWCHTDPRLKNHIISVKINKGEAHLKWSREAGRGRSHALPPVNYRPLSGRTQLWTSAGRDLPCKLVLLYRSSRRRKVSFFAQHLSR